MNFRKKILYFSITGFLTSIAVTACYWQTNRYLDSRKRWSTIAKQLSSQKPQNIASMTQKEKQQNLFPYKYIEIDGKLSDDFKIIDRSRGLRRGYLVLRKLSYPLSQGQGQIIALEGWCPQGYELKNQNERKNDKFRGILRKKQKSDYLHQKVKTQDLSKFNMNTWINLQRYLQQMNIKPDSINTNYYFQILKSMDVNEQKSYGQNLQKESYPYQYSVDNFELPYLTPDKHRGYAMFWASTSMVGLWGIFKVLRMK